MTSPVKQHPASPDTKVPAQSFTANYVHTKYKPKQKDSKEKKNQMKEEQEELFLLLFQEKKKEGWGGGVLRLEVIGERSVLT